MNITKEEHEALVALAESATYISPVVEALIEKLKPSTLYRVSSPGREPVLFEDQGAAIKEAIKMSLLSPEKRVTVFAESGGDSYRLYGTATIETAIKNMIEGLMIRDR